MKQKSIIWIYFACLALLPSAAAQNKPVFEAQLEPSQVSAGAQIQVTFVLENAEGSGFLPPEFKPFQQVGSVENLEGQLNFNGRKSTHTGWRYILLAPENPCVYTLGPASITVQGRRLQTQTLRIEVGKGSDKNEDIFLEGIAQPEQCYVGQQLKYSIELCTRKDINGLDLIEFPSVGDGTTTPLKQFDTSTRLKRVNGREYSVISIFEMAVFPQKSGNLDISSARVRAGLVQAGAAGYLMGPRPVVLSTQPTQIKVLPLPEPAPAGFTGAVGQYNWEIQLDQNNLSTDDATVLRIQLRGNGDSKRIGAPLLTGPDGLEITPAKITADNSYENGTEMLHTLSFEYVLLPHQAGDFSLNAVFCFFDPDSNRYRQLKPVAPLNLHVSAGKQNLVPPPPVVMSDDLSASSWYAPLLRYWPWLLLVSAAAAAVLSLRSIRKSKTAAPSTLPTHQTPKPEDSLRALRNARADSMLFYSLLYQAMQEQLGLRLGIDSANWSEAALRKELQIRHTAEPLQSDIFQLLHRCEAHLYAGLDQSVWIEQSLAAAEKVLKAI